MTTSALDIGNRIARQALVEKRAYIADDSDLDPSFFLEGIPATPNQIAFQSVRASAPSPEGVTEAPRSPGLRRSSYRRKTQMPKTDPVNWTFKQASMYFLEDCETRNREPVKASTLDAYTGHIKHIRAALGERKVSCFSVADMKEFCKTLVGKNLKPKTIQTIVTTLKAIIAFPRDKHLNQLFKMDFDAKVIDMPRVKSRDQKAPIVAREILEAAIASKDETALLLIFLASTGLRVSEALGTRIAEANGASSWHPDEPLVRVRTQQGKNGDDASLKSDAAWRDVELPLDVHEYLRQHANMGNSRLFPQSESQYRKIITERGVPGFHSLRRFYRTSLFDVPAGIMRHWMGHEDGSDISNRYDKLASDPRVRREWRDKINKGFELPV